MRERLFLFRRFRLCSLILRPLDLTAAALKWAITDPSGVLMVRRTGTGGNVAERLGHPNACTAISVVPASVIIFFETGLLGDGQPAVYGFAAHRGV